MRKICLIFFLIMLIPFTQGFILTPRSPPGVAPGAVCLLEGGSGCNMTGDIHMNNNTIYDATFVNATVSGSIEAVDVLNPFWVERAGDTMSGDLDMDGNSLLDILYIYVTKILSNDWSNVTITESQITDLTHIPNTDTQLIAVGPYLSDDGTNIYFSEPLLNSTIDDKLSDISLNASNVTNPIWVERAGDTMTGPLNMSGSNITDVYLLGFDNNLSYFKLHTNGTNTTLQLWVNGMLQQDWGASTTIYQEATFLDNIFGDGSTLLNVCLPEGLTVNGVPCNATSVFDTDEIWILNIGGNATFNETLLNLTIDDRLNGTHSVGAGKYLYNVNDGNKTNIYINDSVLISTIDNRTGIFELNISVDIAGGTGVNSSVFSFPRLSEILEVTVTPTTLTNKYRVHINGTTTGIFIDKDRIPHVGIWHVAHEGTIIQGETITATITEATIDENFIVNLKYRQ